MEEGKRNQGLCMRYKRWFSILDCIHGRSRDGEWIREEKRNSVITTCSMGMSMNGWMPPTPALHRDNYLFPRLTPSVEVTQVVQTALPEHYQGYRCELIVHDLILQLWERSRGWDGGKEDGRLWRMERRTVAGMGGWMTEENCILG